VRRGEGGIGGSFLRKPGEGAEMLKQVLGI
jgi:hypothetical protein